MDNAINQELIMYMEEVWEKVVTIVYYFIELWLNRISTTARSSWLVDWLVFVPFFFFFF